MYNNPLTIEIKPQETSGSFLKVEDIIIGLLGPNGEEMFKEAGFELDCYCQDFTLTRKGKMETLMSVDFFAYGKNLAIATQVETNCNKRSIEIFLAKMTIFKKLFPEHADKVVLAAIAAVNFERDAYDYAKEQGILIIHVKDETVFTLDPVPDKSVLRRF